MTINKRQDILKKKRNLLSDTSIFWMLMNDGGRAEGIGKEGGEQSGQVWRKKHNYRVATFSPTPTYNSTPTKGWGPTDWALSLLANELINHIFETKPPLKPLTDAAVQGASGLVNTLKGWSVDPREAIEVLDYCHLNPSPFPISPIWFFLSCILYSKATIFGRAFPWVLWVVLLNHWIWGVVVGTLNL